MDNEMLLDVKHLSVSYHTYAGEVRCVRDISFSVKRGECVAVVGESSCGKSVTMKALMGLIRGPLGEIKKESSIVINNENILDYDSQRWDDFRGNTVSMIFQDALAALNPTMKIGRQIEEVILNHQDVNKMQAKKRAIELLEKVGIPDAAKRAEQYPHEFSGGMRQRVMIAIAIAGAPDLLIADEPTTALDVTIQGQILDLIKRLQEEQHVSVLLVTHDLGVVAGMAQRVVVMYAGVIVEQGAVEDIFYKTKHPYTAALLKSQPRLNDNKSKEMNVIEGTPPDLLNPPQGCPFCYRCTKAMKLCKLKSPKMKDFGNGHMASCWLFDDDVREYFDRKEENGYE